MRVLDLLKWAAGAPISLPGIEGIQDERLLCLLGIDEDAFLDLLAKHRLAQRFLDRYRRERPGWCSPTLLGRVLELGALAQKHTRRQLDALHEITRALDPAAPPLIAIKGFTTYALTGQEKHLRQSADLDLFAPDPAVLFDHLLRLGYTGFQKGLDHHEWAEMQRQDIKIEIHRCFPVYSYPPGITACDLVPEHHPGLWHQPFTQLHRREIGDDALMATLQAEGARWNRTLRHREIHYEDLLAHSVCGTTPDTADLRVPHPNMAAFLLCAHEFMNYAGPLLMTALPVKLAILADILDLTRHPQFDLPGFLSLAERFQGQDALAFVGGLLQTCFGSNPFPLLRPPDPLRRGGAGTGKRRNAGGEKDFAPPAPQFCGESNPTRDRFPPNLGGRGAQPQTWGVWGAQT